MAVWVRWAPQVVDQGLADAEVVGVAGAGQEVEAARVEEVAEAVVEIALDWADLVAAVVVVVEIHPISW